MAKVNPGFGVVTALSLAMFAGCSQDAAPGKPVSTDSLPSSADKEMAHADHGSGDGQGHVGMGEMAKPATLIVDTGGDDLRPGLTTTLRFHLEREGTALQEFILLHERPMHFIVVRDALEDSQTEVSAQKGESEWQVTFLHSDLAGKPLTDLEPYRREDEFHGG